MKPTSRDANGRKDRVVIYPAPRELGDVFVDYPVRDVIGMQQRSGMHALSCLLAMRHKVSTYNTLIMILVAVPPICSTYLVRHGCSFVTKSNIQMPSFPCLMYFKPLDILNWLFFLHVDLTFYSISLIQVRASVLCLSRVLSACLTAHSPD